MLLQTRKQNAFTLVEILVVIGIISVLMVIGVGAASSMRESARAKSTEALLGQFDAILNEYKAVTRGSNPPINKSGTGTAGEIKPAFDAFMNELKSIGADTPLGSILNTINRDFFPHGLDIRDTTANTNDSAGDSEAWEYVIDSWDNPIALIDADGTGHGGVTNQPKKSTPYFASAGPDGRWGVFIDGDFDQPDERPNIEEQEGKSSDNLYSFNAVR